MESKGLLASIDAVRAARAAKLSDTNRQRWLAVWQDYQRAADRATADEIQHALQIGDWHTVAGGSIAHWVGRAIVRQAPAEETALHWLITLPGGPKEIPQAIGRIVRAFHEDAPSAYVSRLVERLSRLEVPANVTTARRYAAIRHATIAELGAIERGQHRTCSPSRRAAARALLTATEGADDAAPLTPDGIAGFLSRYESLSFDERLARARRLVIPPYRPSIAQGSPLSPMKTLIRRIACDVAYGYPVLKAVWGANASPAARHLLLAHGELHVPGPWWADPAFVDETLAVLATEPLSDQTRRYYATVLRQVLLVAEPGPWVAAVQAVAPKQLLSLLQAWVSAARPPVPLEALVPLLANPDAVVRLWVQQHLIPIASSATPAPATPPAALTAGATPRGTSLP